MYLGRDSHETEIRLKSTETVIYMRTQRRIYCPALLINSFFHSKIETPNPCKV